MPKTDNMPTSARLIAAIALAALGWVASDMIRPLMPPHTAFGRFNYVNAVLGLLCGWFVIGSRTGVGYVDAISIGLTGGAALVFWALFAQSFNLMLKQSFDRDYKGPMEAIIGIFNNAMDYIVFLWDVPLIVTLVLGSIAVGLLAEFIARRWT